ncbi:MAG: hypothetical protein ACOYIF_12805 [Acetivibrionales bacterium]|jgi:WD40 repeat protein
MSKALSVYNADHYFDGDIVIDHDMAVNIIKLSPDGKTLMTHCRNGYLYTWDVEDGKLLGKLYTNKNTIYDNYAIFIDDNTIITTTSGSKYDDYITCIDILGNIKWQVEDYSTKLTYSAEKKVLA